MDVEPAMMEPPSVGSTQDPGSEPGIEESDHEVRAAGGLRKAIMNHFACLARTQEMHQGAPVVWNAAEWNERTWKDRNMEADITQLFLDLGLSSSVATMKDAGLKNFPCSRTNGFWLAVWKFRMDRSAKNGRLALSPAQLVSNTFAVLVVVAGICLAEPAVAQSDPRCAL